MGLRVTAVEPGPITGYCGRGWAVVASTLTIACSDDPDLLTVDGDTADRATADRAAEASAEYFVTQMRRGASVARVRRV